jgi:hypothetical protein
VAQTIEVETAAVADGNRGYAGSRYSEVVAAILANPYQRIWGAEGEPQLPVHEVTFKSVFGGLLFGMTRQFQSDCERTLDSPVDLRWGSDGKGFPRLVHPNGVCLTGEWRISEDTPYSGYFRKGSHALAVGRYSTCCTETFRLKPEGCGCRDYDPRYPRIVSTNCGKATSGSSISGCQPFSHSKP